MTKWGVKKQRESINHNYSQVMKNFEDGTTGIRAFEVELMKMPFPEILLLQIYGLEDTDSKKWKNFLLIFIKNKLQSWMMN